jgi:hypothetical protein
MPARARVLQLVPALEPWVAVIAVDDPAAADGVRLFTRRSACWALMQQPGDVVRLEGLSAQEEAAGATAVARDPDSPLAVLGYAPADEVRDLPADRTDWRELARHWPAMRRAAQERQRDYAPKEAPTPAR